MSTTPLFALPAPRPASTREGRPRLGDPGLPAGSYDDACVGVPWVGHDDIVRRAVASVCGHGAAALTRCVRIGAHLGAPVHALAAVAASSTLGSMNASDITAAVAASVRAAARRAAPSSHAEVLTTLAEYIVAAAAVRGTIRRQHQPDASYTAVVRAVESVVALHDALDTLLTPATEAAVVLYNQRTGDFRVCSPKVAKQGKTFVDYRPLDTWIDDAVIRVTRDDFHTFVRV